MKFYPHRSVQEQMNRLPLDVRENYEQTQLDRILIDGELITGYFEYSFLEEKSYVTQPVRSDSGVIEGIEDYQTFLTPRIIIRYNMMNIDDYRKLMKLLKSKNAFDVECYDIVEDKRVVHEMYFAPPSMPVIYQQYLKALGIQEYTIELIGTNRKVEFNIVYNFNFPSDATFYYPGGASTDQDFVKQTGLEYNKKILIGNIKLVDLNNQALTDTVTNYSLVGWNTDRYGRGFTYKDNTRYFISSDLVLYAQWRRK